MLEGLEYQEKDHENVHVTRANGMVIFKSFEQKYFNLDGSDCCKCYFHNLNEKIKSNFRRRHGGSLLVVRSGISLKRMMSLACLR